MQTPIRHLVLGITGGIAAYKAAELTRLLIKHGIEVQVVMTEAATQFITPVTMQALSGKPVMTAMWDQSIPNGMPHIELSREADAILIAPASADFLAKLVHGQADDLLSTLCLARDCPLIVAPAMNKQMWENPATQRNIAQLRLDGVHVIGPGIGEQACGEVGLGRMLEPDQIIQALEAFQQPKLFVGKRILITAGPTQEAIDPVRVLTNLSSGKMGYSIAKAAVEMGADVHLVSGPVHLRVPDWVNCQQVTSCADMLNAVMADIANFDIFISVAAVADYRPAHPQQQKIKKQSQTLTVTLEPNPDILATVASLPNPPFCVGFAAETDQLLHYANEKRQRKHLPLIVANLATEALGSDNNSLVLIDDAGEHALPTLSKQEAARRLLAHIANMLTSKP